MVKQEENPGSSARSASSCHLTFSLLNQPVIGCTPATCRHFFIVYIMHVAIWTASSMNAVLYLLFIFVVLLQRKIPSGHTYWQGVLLFYSSRRFLSDFYCGRGEAFHVLRNVPLTDNWYFSSSRPFRIFTGCCYLKLLLFSGLALGFFFICFIHCGCILWPQTVRGTGSWPVL